MQGAKPTFRLYSAKAKAASADNSDHPAEPLTVEQAFARYSGYVAEIAFRMLGRDDQIDDVVQDVFMVALKNLAHLREPAALKGWLATITVRFAGRRLRLRRLRLLFGLDRAPRYEEVVAPAARPEARILLGQIYALLDELPVQKRLAWILRHIQGESLDEVARLCDCSLSAAKRRIEAADQALRRMLSDG
jgi:RNA polymerase sigma-70 factor (ECF subfamily)